MANTELDPLFLKGLRLLHSKSKDSAEQLKQLLDEALMQAKQSAAASKDLKGFSSIKIESESKLHLKKSVSRDDTIKQIQEETRKREAEKRLQEKISGHAEDIEMVHEPKIPKLDSPQGMPYYPSSPDIPPKLDHFVPRKMEEDSDSSDENADADDFAMEMGLACVICKQLDVTQGNQLIECQECHSLYHQECHTPPATDYDVNDPRRVWYCAKCTKTMKKMASKTQKTTKSVTTVAATSTTTTSQTRFTKPESSQPPLVLPFKRTELKAPVSQGNNQASANKPAGLAGLAANFGGRTATAAASLSSSTRPSSSKSAPTTPIKSYSSLSSSSSTYGIVSSIKSANSSATSVKIVSASSHSPSSSVPPLVITKNISSSSSVKSGLGLLSSVSAAAAAARTPPVSSSSPSSSSSSSCSSSSTSSSSANNGGTKPATCSLLMSADKRVQIMKKRAAKMQEKRRMSTK